MKHLGNINDNTDIITKEYLETRVKTDVPTGAKFTDTITDIADNLTTDDATKALSAKQGKILDEKSPNKEFYVPHSTKTNHDTGNAEGYQTTASGYNSHAQNEYTIAQGEAQTAIGKYNIPQGVNNWISPDDHAFIIGNGTDGNNRSNALAVNWNGDLDIAGYYKINGNVMVEPTITTAWEKFEIETITASVAMSAPMGGGINLNVSAEGVFDWAVGDKVISASIVTDGAGTISPELESPLIIVNFEEMGFNVTGTNANLYPAGDDFMPLIIGNTTHPQLGKIGAFATYGVDGTSVTVEVLRNPTVVYSDDADAYPDSGQVGDYYYIKMSPVRGLESRVKTDVPAGAKFTDTVYTHPASHPASMITGLPTSLPASGGNADTVGGFTVGVSVPADAVFTDTIYMHPNKHSISEVDGLQMELDRKMSNNEVVLGEYVEELITLTGPAPTISLLEGSVFKHTLTHVTTYSIANAVNNVAHSFTLIITQESLPQTIIFPTSVKWQGGEIPDMITASKTYVLTFMTVDGGTNWLGMFGGEF